MRRAGGGGGRGKPEKGRDKPQETVAKPQPIWGMLYADDAGIVSKSRDNLAKRMADIVGIDSFGFQDRDHVPNDETCGQGLFRY